MSFSFLGSRWSFFIVAFLSLSGLSLSGCSEFLKGNKKPETVIDFESQETACLKSIPQFLKFYFKDKSSAAEIDTNFACLQKGVKTFLKFTRGKAADQYTDQELQHFFNRYLLTENQITEPFLQQLMKLKTMIVGGSSQIWTRVELELLTQYLDLVRLQFHELAGSMEMILFRREVDVTRPISIEELKVTQQKVLKSVSALIFASKVANSEFEFADIESFGAEVSRFMGSEGVLSSFLKWAPLMNRIKVLFLGSHLKLQSRSEWTENIRWAVETYFLAQRYYYQTRHLQYQSGDDWTQVIQFSDWMIELISSSPAMATKGFLPIEDIDNLITEIYNLKIFELKLSLEVAKNTYKKAIYHLIDGNASSRGESFEIREINQRQWAIIKFEYEVWRQTQLMLAEIFSEKTDLPQQELLAKYGRYNKEKNMRAKGNLRDLLMSAWTEWTQILNKKRPAVMSQDHKIGLASNPVHFSQNLRGLSLSVALRTLTRLTLRGYGETGSSGRDFFATALLEPRIIDLEFDFREFGNAVGFLDPRQNGAPQRTFKEGNYFTFSGNGDGRFDGYEIFELLHFMISAGDSLSHQIESLIEANQGHLVERDIMERPKSQEKVFRQVIEENFAQIFHNMPELVAAKSKMTAAEWQEIYAITRALSRVADAKPGVTEYAEIRGFVAIIQYAESLFLQFDADHSGGLSYAELLLAEPRFHELVLSLSPVRSEWLAKEAFLYLVTSGKVPTLDLGLLKFAKQTALFVVFKGAPPELNSDLIRFARRRLLSSESASASVASRLQLFRVLAVLKSHAI